MTPVFAKSLLTSLLQRETLPFLAKRGMGGDFLIYTVHTFVLLILLQAVLSFNQKRFESWAKRFQVSAEEMMT
jgi:hypothetical protein